MYFDIFPKMNIQEKFREKRDCFVCQEWIVVVGNGVDKVKTICKVSQILSYYSLVKHFLLLLIKMLSFRVQQQSFCALKGLKLEQKESVLQDFCFVFHYKYKHHYINMQIKDIKFWTECSEFTLETSVSGVWKLNQLADICSFQSISQKTRLFSIWCNFM